jgi:hypothetical protein
MTKGISLPGASRWRSLVRPLRHRFLAALAVALLAGTPGLHALVISEIMYHPGGAVDDRPFEYLELYNEELDPLDLSGFFICNGVFFEFPPGTWLEGKSYLLVCADEDSVQSRYGVTNTIGSWFTDPVNSPSLDNGGEHIEICNPGGKTVAEVTYNDRGKWPGGADGTGHSLSLIRAFRENDDPDNWALSALPGGTPGVSNGFDPDETGAVVTGSPMDASGFILKWLVLGPYTGSHCALGADLSADWLRDSGAVDEKDLIWRDGQIVNTNYALAASVGLHPNAGTALPTIEEYAGFSDTINFNDAIWSPDPNQVMAYAFVYVDNMTASPRNVDIACASDDAISVLVNGVYVHTNDACRGVGAGGEVQDRAPATLAVGKNLITVKVFEDGGGWSFRLRLENRGAGTPITSSDIIRITTDPDEGLNFGGGGTPIPPPPVSPGGGTEPALQPVVINEGLLRTSGQRWIELYNRTTSVQNIAGLYITDEAANLTKARIPAGITLPARGFRAFTDAELGLDFRVSLPGDRVFVALVSADGSHVLDAYTFEPEFAEYSEARIPDGTREFDDAADPTRAAANAISANDDVVINEIMYHPIDDDNRKEYVELFNRGAVAHDLTGWSLSNGLDYPIPDGTTIAAQGYLVITRDPELVRTIHGLPPGAVLGPDTPEALADFGVLRNRGERLTLSDELGRTVDTVRYHDGGEWSRWADGHGSALELIDSAQDNGFGQAWDASDDSGKAVVDTFSYTGRHTGGEPELDLLLLSRGITVVDDVSIIGGGITTQDTPLIDTGVPWRYFKGTQEPPAAWKNIGFSDTSWLSGATGIGYGDNDDTTVLADMQQVLPDQTGYMSIFCRRTFTVANPASIRDLILSVQVDDGFYAYLNGTQVASHNINAPAFDSPAPSAIEPTVIERDITEFKNLLVAGTNVLAIQVHNAGLGSTDLTFNPRLLSREVIDVGGGTEMVTNGNFNTNVAGWMIDGTHVRSGRTTQGPINGSGSLKVIASGRGDNKVNRLETPQANGSGLANLPLNEDLLISLKARWVIGSQTILTHGYEHGMAKVHELSVPLNLGTPGRVNGVTQRAGGRLGPVITDVTQVPAVPQDGEVVRVSAKVSDSDGITSVTLRYSLSNPAASPASVAMSDPDGDGIFAGNIPGQTLGTRVVFFVTAADATGRQGRYPADVLQRTHPLVLNPAAG